MAFKYIEAKEISTFTILDTGGADQEMVTIQTATNHVFAVLASYITQEVGALHDPYSDSILVFKLTDNDGIDAFTSNDGKIVLSSEVEYIF